MSPAVCISGSVGFHTNTGGQAWLYLDLGLGFAAAGCRVLFLTSVDGVPEGMGLERYAEIVAGTLRGNGLDGPIVFCSHDVDGVPPSPDGLYLTVEECASDVDLYVNVGYISDEHVVRRFRRSAYVDTDPGVFQIWLSRGDIAWGPHDRHFTISPTIAAGESRAPDCGISWELVPPWVFLPAWPVVPAPPGAPYTTVSNWWGVDEWIRFDGSIYNNEKRTAFLNYLELPRSLTIPLELAVTLEPCEPDITEARRLEEHGWRVRSILPGGWKDGVPDWTPAAYREFVRGSRGEWSWAKPMYRRLETGIVFNRTLHYLASGKPAVVEYTGPLAPLVPDDGLGLLQFRDLDEARDALVSVEAGYDLHCRAARRLVEERFDAEAVARSILERSL